MLARRSRLFSSLVNLRGVVVVAPAATWGVACDAAESVPGGGAAMEVEAAGGG